jgi:hypothetical protein
MTSDNRLGLFELGVLGQILEPEPKEYQCREELEAGFFGLASPDVSQRVSKSSKPI